VVPGSLLAPRKETTATVPLGLASVPAFHSARPTATVHTHLRASAAQVEQAVALGAFPRPLPGSALDLRLRRRFWSPTSRSGRPSSPGRPARFYHCRGSPCRFRAGRRRVLPAEAVRLGEHATAGGLPVIVIPSTHHLRRQSTRTVRPAASGDRVSRPACPCVRDDMGWSSARAAPVSDAAARPAAITYPTCVGGVGGGVLVLFYIVWCILVVLVLICGCWSRVLYVLRVFLCVFVGFCACGFSSRERASRLGGCCSPVERRCSLSGFGVFVSFVICFFFFVFWLLLGCLWGGCFRPLSPSRRHLTTRSDARAPP